MKAFDFVPTRAHNCGEGTGIDRLRDKVDTPIEEEDVYTTSVKTECLFIGSIVYDVPRAAPPV